MAKGKLPRVLLDRNTLLYAAEAALVCDKCALCGQPLTEREAHRLHPRATSIQRAAQIQIAMELQTLAATAVDLKGRRRVTAKA